MAQVPKEETFEGAGGLKLFMRSWRPEGPPRAVVVISHGFNSHSGQYLWVGEQLAAMGFSVYAPDYRGRGRSEGERFHVERVGEYEDDLSRVIGIAKSRDPGLPVFLLGHSAGGVIACIYALDQQAELAGLICESFAFRVPAPDIALQVIKGVSHLAPNVGVLKLKNEDFSRDLAVVKAMNDDPLIHDETQPSITVAALQRADERLTKEIPTITLPVLIIHGTEDKATLPKGSQFFHEHAGSADKTLKLYEGHFHDLLNDLGKEEVLGDIVGWIEARI
ncbi:alpha/beta hydrolase [Phenylobacterium sp.]|uniref:alpha/beta hydrolase n=1 Tax=Phenylobacterium sp. TaxID=1871053 RepID=UPI0028A1FF62|nr:alpha/beta hydrolase [Phenylobacterium sp.]